MNQLLEQLTSLLKQLRLWVMIAPWEQGVRVRRGCLATQLLPGWHFLLPILDTVYVFNVRRRSISISTQTITTRAGRTITIAGHLGYYINDLLKLFSTTYGVDDVLVQHAHAAIAREVAAATGVPALADLVAAVQVAVNAAVAGAGISGIEVLISDIVEVRASFRVINDQRYGTFSQNLREVDQK